MATASWVFCTFGIELLWHIISLYKAFGGRMTPNPIKKRTTYVGRLELVAIVNARYSGFAVTDGRIVADPRRQKAHLCRWVTNKRKCLDEMEVKSVFFYID